MNLDRFIGPATFVFLIGAIISGATWVGGIDTRVAQVETTLSKRENESDRITKLETLVSHVDRQLDKIENKIDRLGQNQR